MNTDQPAKWLKVTFFVSLSIFFLASVKLLDSNINASGFFSVLTDSPNLYQIINVFQYLNIAAFLVMVIMTFRQRQNLQTVILFTVWGIFTLLTVWMLASYKESIDFDIPMTGDGSALDTLTVYISALSGLIAAVSALYNQINTGRKALAEVQVEKLRLQVEQEKAKARIGTRKSTSKSVKRK